MRFPSLTCVFALASAFAVVGCGSPNINHGNGGSGGTGGGGAGGAGGSGGTGGTGGTGGSGGGGMSNNCGVMNFMLAKGGTPDLLIIQDRSGSMAWDAAGNMNPPVGTPTRWSSITAAINQVVSSVNTVDWGLLFFPGIPILPIPDCSVSSTPAVGCGPNTASAIAKAISGATPNGGTPTMEAINAGVMYFKGNTDGRGHYMLLATDGEPGCGIADETTGSEQAVTSAAMAGIKTIVVGIGSTGADATLSVLANNGGMPNMTAGQKPYYEVSSTADLVTVLNKIAGQIVSCNYPLQMAPPNPDYLEIDGNGMTIPRDKTHMNGWDYGPNNLSIDFYGPACDALQKGVTTSVSAIFGCPPVG